MNIKRVLAGLSAAAVAGSIMATTAFADEPTVYGIAGISFQVRDSWEHRDAVGQELLDESGSTPFDATCYDVNITGNGTYEISLEGWWCDFDESLMGWIGLSTTMEVEKIEVDGEEKTVFKDYPDATMTLISYTQDGTEFDLTGAEMGLEDGGGGMGAIKVVNSWNNPQIDLRGDEYECLTWKTTDPVIIKFTVEGLPTDKAEDYEEEVIEFISGKGAGATDEPTDTPADDESSAAEDSEAADESSAEEDSAPESVESVDEASTGAAESEADESSSNLPLYLGIGGGVVVLAAIVAIVIKVKK